MMHDAKGNLQPSAAGRPVVQLQPICLNKVGGTCAAVIHHRNPSPQLACRQVLDALLATQKPHDSSHSTSSAYQKVCFVLIIAVFFIKVY